MMFRSDYYLIERLLHLRFGAFIFKGFFGEQERAFCQNYYYYYYYYYYLVIKQLYSITHSVNYV